MNIKTFGDPPVPDWVVSEVEKAAKKLGIHQGWYISIALSDKPHGLDGKDGANYTEVPYFQSGLEFAPDLTDDDAGRDLVWHEVAHILTAPLLEAAYKALDQIKSKPARKLAKRLVDDAEEALVNQLIIGLRESVNEPSG